MVTDHDIAIDPYMCKVHLLVVHSGSDYVHLRNQQRAASVLKNIKKQQSHAKSRGVGLVGRGGRGRGAEGGRGGGRDATFLTSTKTGLQGQYKKRQKASMIFIVKYPRSASSTFADPSTSNEPPAVVSSPSVAQGMS